MLLAMARHPLEDHAQPSPDEPDGAGDYLSTMYLQVAGMYGYADDPELVQDHPDGEWPVHHHFQGEPIPDLARIALADWPRALRPVSALGRESATDNDRLVGAGKPVVRSLIQQLSLEDAGRRRRVAQTLHTVGPLPRPDAARMRTTPRRQVNFRLTEEEHRELVEAARLAGATPPALAKLLTVRGVRQVLFEERSRGG
jgi:hypothetical protein